MGINEFINMCGVWLESNFKGANLWKTKRELKWTPWLLYGCQVEFLGIMIKQFNYQFGAVLFVN